MLKETTQVSFFLQFFREVTMSKYSDKTFEKILDDLPNRVTEVSTMEWLFYSCRTLTKWST